MDLGRLMGIGRAGVLGGLVVVSAGLFLSRAAVAWAGVGLVALALVVNSAAKVTTYGRLDVPAGQRALVAGAWLLVAAGVLALVADYTYARFTAGYEGYFASLAIGVAGLAMVYQGTRSKFVPGGGAGE